MTIDYETVEYDPRRHQRFLNSNPNGYIIRQYLWPALIDKSNGNCLHKAVVIT